ncbi:hypothetical protein [Streptomyces shenzhenensis]|uniref:hypothetical protein n=1 Tax=Streptomyces shenzhenensis TaxID=943815 RepID=UPI001F3AF885|nr:hypothetical protein [Streptomyces shenzhenensis]
MTRRRTRAATAASLALAGALALGACAADAIGGGNAGATIPATSAGTTPGPGGTSPSAGPTSGWGPGMWGGTQGPGMMGGPGSWAPGMMGQGMMGNWWLAGNGNRVQTLDQARQRAQAFADRLGLKAGEVMQFSRNFYAELETSGGRMATEVLVNPVDGAVQIEYGPAMMWNTDYGMRYGSQSQVRVSAAQARSIAQQWLRGQGTGLTAGEADSFPGYYTLHTLKSGRITGMLSVNATTGQVWYHSWHGGFVAMSDG